jgi:hypothetical protein
VVELYCKVTIGYHPRMTSSRNACGCPFRVDLGLRTAAPDTPSKVGIPDAPHISAPFGLSRMPKAPLDFRSILLGPETAIFWLLSALRAYTKAP